MKNKLLGLLTKIKERVKNNKIPIIIFTVIWIVVIIVTLNIYKSSLGMESNGNDNFVNSEADVQAIDKNSKITEIVNFDENVESISIRFATYARKNSGTLRVFATGESSKDIYLDETVNVNSIQDNAFLTFKLDKANYSNENIVIELTSTSNTENCIGVYFSSEKAFDDSSFAINGVEQEGDLKVRFLSNNEVLNGFSNSVIIWIIIGFTIIMIFVLLCDRLEVIFTVSALILGLIFMIVITPMSPPDEQTHYEYSFQVSNYMMGHGNNHIEMDAEYQNYTGFAGHANVSSAYATFVKKINKPLSLKNSTITMENDINEASYALCYIPQAIGIFIARIFKVNMLKTFYSGRLFNLIFYVICVYVALKKAPIHKTIFGLIATMPIMLQQAASYSYDTFLNGLMLVEIGFFLNWMFGKEQISNKDIVELLIVTLLVAPLKAIYSLITFAFWFIPSTRFGSKKRKIISISILCVPILIRLLILLLPSIESVFRHLDDNKTGNNSLIKKIFADTGEEEYIGVNMDGGLEEGNYSIGHAIRNFGDTINLYYRTIRYNIKIWFYESIGRTLSGVSLVLPLTFVHFLTGILLVSAFRKEKFVLSLPVKGYFFFACVCIGLLAMAGMMITWTRPGDEYIQGMQGRYFSPLLPYFFTIFNNKKLTIPAKFDKYIIFAQLLVLFEVIMYVLSFTFVN